MIKWHKIYGRDMDDEEREYYKESGVTIILEDTPDDGDEVLKDSGRIDAFINEGTDGCYWESGDDVELGEKWCLLSDIIEELDNGSRCNT